MTEENVPLRHWIYVLGEEDLLAPAAAWAARKTAQHKDYRVIPGARSGLNAGKLLEVSPGDVLYVLSRTVRHGNLGDWEVGPLQLAAHLQSANLNHSHRDLKLFASHTGDASDGPSYAERVYAAMRPQYPDIVVYGYKGVVDTEGYDGHKTAGLEDGEALHSLSHEAWKARKARASENRVRFPEESGGHSEPAVSR